MKKIFVVFLFLCSFLYSNSLNLTTNDLLVLKKIKSLSSEEMIQYSLMAIVIKESSLGKNQINFQTEDFGPFQANIYTILRRLNVKDSLQNRIYYANKLINDVGFATANAIIELEYWRKVHKNNWAKIWASYNTGFNYETNSGVEYATSIFEIIRKLKLEYNL